MLQGEATYSDFSKMSSRPYAEVRVDGHVFRWHGNFVIEGTHREGRVWTSPMMQALINQLYSRPDRIEEWNRALNELDADTNISQTVVQPLGAYPKL